jgi:hypothetical protein
MSINVNRPLSPTAPPSPTPPTGPRQTPTQTQAPSSPPSHIRHSQGQSQQVSQTTSATTVQQGSQLIAQAPPGAISAQHQGSSPMLQATEFGKKLAQAGAKVHDASEAIGEFEIGGVKPMEHIGSGIEAITGDFEIGGTKLPSAEGALLEYATGLSPDSVKGAKDLLDGGLKVAQACKTASSLHQAYLSYGTDQFSGNLATASKSAFVTFGGKPTVELADKVGSFCSKLDLESAGEMAKAAKEFGSDDSLISGLGRTALTSVGTYALGETATHVVSSSIPFLSFGVAAMDSATALKKGYDWANGNGSGIDALKSTVTAIGSGTGATVAPIIGPLAATAINLGIDGVGLAAQGVSSAYNFVSSWWA